LFKDMQKPVHLFSTYGHLINSVNKHPFNGLFPGTTWVSWHQKGKNHSGF